MTITKIFTIVTFASLALSALAIEPADLCGTWQLVSVTKTSEATGKKIDVLGPHPAGYLTYGTNGRMVAILVASPRPKPTDLAKVTDEDRLKLYRSFVSYAGTFTLNGSTVIHHVDISSNETWTGTDQIRHLKLEGDTLFIWTDPKPNPIDGEVTVDELKWVKLRAEN